MPRKTTTTTEELAKPPIHLFLTSGRVTIRTPKCDKVRLAVASPPHILIPAYSLFPALAQSWSQRRHQPLSPWCLDFP